MKFTTIAIDAMSGDHGVSVTVPGALALLDKYDDLKIILVGQEAALNTELAKHTVSQRVSVFNATEVVEMTDLPSMAMKKKKDSSLRQAINLIKQGQADACVSAGNTGALMATARFVLKTLPGIDRPALITALPTQKGHMHILDLGTNIDSSSEMLMQFAVMGSEVAKTIDNIERPTIGLLNIGVEEIKGSEAIRQAGEMLKRSPLNYTGYIEADTMYEGGVDVVVCDGFIGNVALKASEGVAKMIGGAVKEAFSSTFFRKLLAALVIKSLNDVKNRFDHRRHNGATLVGLNGTVVKSHGSSDAFAFQHAVEKAYIEAKEGLPAKIAEQVHQVLSNMKLSDEAETDAIDTVVENK